MEESRRNLPTRGTALGVRIMPPQTRLRFTRNRQRVESGGQQNNVTRLPPEQGGGGDREGGTVCMY